MSHEQAVDAAGLLRTSDRFLSTFSAKGLEKRREPGSGGACVFRGPSDNSRIWALFDMDEESYQGLLSDPDMPAIFQEAGLQAPPQTAELGGEYEA
jgi:hypothetical protein